MFAKFNDDVARYKKKRNKKQVKKTKHKHEYSKDVLIETYTKYGPHFHYATICHICGKIGKEKYMESAKKEGSKYWRLLNQCEILEKYKDLPIIKID